MSFTREKVRPALDEAVCVTMEEIAFMEAYPMESRTEVDLEVEAAWTCVQLAYDIGVSGTLTCSIGSGLLSQITDAMYSIPPLEQTPEMQADVHRELVNILTGNYLATVTGGGVDFSLGLPETITRGTVQLNSTFLYDIEEHLLEIQICDMEE